jgi:hypothetical protein
MECIYCRTRSCCGTFYVCCHSFRYKECVDQINLTLGLHMGPKAPKHIANPEFDLQACSMVYSCVLAAFLALVTKVPVFISWQCGQVSVGSASNELWNIAMRQMRCSRADRPSWYLSFRCQPHRTARSCRHAKYNEVLYIVVAKRVQ